MPSTGSTTQPWVRLWHFLAPDRREIGYVVAFAIGLGVLTLATPIAVQSLVNFIAFGGLMQPLVVVGVLLLAFLVFAGAITVFKSVVVEIIQRRVFVRIVAGLAARLPRVPVASFDRRYGPEVVNRFFDVLTVQKASATLLLDGLDMVLRTSIGLLVLGFYHPLLLLFDAVLVASILFIVFVLGRGSMRSAREESQAKYEVADGLEELVRAPSTYKLECGAGFAEARIGALTASYIGARRRHYAVVLRQHIGTAVLQAVAATGLLTTGGYLVIAKQLTLGQLVAAELIVSVALASFLKFSRKLESVYDLMAGTDKLGVLFDLPIESPTGSTEPLDSGGAVLELRNVTGGIDDGVRDFSLLVESGERVAVFGPRASGKTGIAEMLVGLRVPSSGVALVDGVDRRELSRDALRMQINFARRGEYVSGTVLDNLLLGRPGVDFEDAREVLDQLGLLEELVALPDGLQTILTPLGLPLSDATGDLLMIARAVLARPRAIVIDGCLDGLDIASRERAMAVVAADDAPWTLVVTTRQERVASVLPRVVQTREPLKISAGEES